MLVYADARDGWYGRTVGHDGQAHLTDPHAPVGLYQATWNVQTLGRYCSTIAGFLPAK
jgi:hypothetical protein